MELLKSLASKYNHDDALTTVALLALIVYAFHSDEVQLDRFGEAVAAIFGGHAVRSWGNSKEPQ